MREFRLEELSQFNGQGGRPIYVAYQGKVVDVTESRLWKSGVHMKRHHAGNDLSTDFQAAPHGPEVLERYPQVGVLKKEGEEARKLPVFLIRLLKFAPMLRRHPHPMTVHFPIVFMFSTTIFNLLYLLTGRGSFEITALHCLGAGILFTPLVMLTGYYTWWLNYLSKPLRPVYIKQRLSFLLLAMEIAALVWRLEVPGILSDVTFGSVVYSILVFSFLPLVTVIGWYGAQLTFPIERET
jgi:predicted heme/steroid binding protein/uncharacterized membrane protein